MGPSWSSYADRAFEILRTSRHSLTTIGEPLPSQFCRARTSENPFGQGLTQLESLAPVGCMKVILDAQVLAKNTWVGT